jgi:hypothetical protein
MAVKRVAIPLTNRSRCSISLACRSNDRSFVIIDKHNEPSIVAAVSRRNGLVCRPRSSVVSDGLNVNLLLPQLTITRSPDRANFT